MTTAVPVGPSPSGGGPDPSEDWDDVLADLGDRIRAERQARAWSQQQLAQRAGLSAPAVHRLETGRTRATLSAYASACRAFGLALDYLLSARWEMPERRSRTRLTPRQADVLQAAEAGGTLSDVAQRLGTSRQLVGARLSEAYRVLGVADLPPERRRAVALRVARERGLLPARAPEVDGE